MKTQKTIFFKLTVSPLILVDYTRSAYFETSFVENSYLNLQNTLLEHLIERISAIVSNFFEMNQVVDKYNIRVVAEKNTVYGMTDAIKKIKEMNYSTLIKLEKNVVEKHKIKYR